MREEAARIHSHRAFLSRLNKYPKTYQPCSTAHWGSPPSAYCTRTCPLASCSTTSPGLIMCNCSAKHTEVDFESGGKRVLLSGMLV